MPLASGVGDVRLTRSPAMLPERGLNDAASSAGEPLLALLAVSPPARDQRRGDRVGHAREDVKRPALGRVVALGADGGHRACSAGGNNSRSETPSATASRRRQAGQACV